MLLTDHIEELLEKTHLFFQRHWKVIFIVFLCYFALTPFNRLQTKQIWVDELLSLIYATGHTSKEFYDRFYGTPNPFSSDDLRTFLKPKGNIRTVIQNVLEHYPLQSLPYYVLLHYWIKLFGNSNTALGALSALVHLWVFPAGAWFFYELYGWSVSTFLALGFLAISPLHIQYAQEARSYQLWIIFFYLLNAGYLRALRTNGILSWLAYGVILTSSMYLSLFAIPVWAAHILSLSLRSRKGIRPVFGPLLKISVAAWALFAPYLVISFVSGAAGVPSEMAWLKPHSLEILLRFTGENFQRLFFDFLEATPGVEHYFSFTLAFLFSAYCVGYVFTERENPLRPLLVTIIGTNFIPLLLWDLTQSSIASGLSRYVLPTVLVVQLAVAHTLAVKQSQGSFWVKTSWRVFASALILLQMTWVFWSSPKALFINQGISQARSVLLQEKQNSLLLRVKDFDPMQAQGGGEMLNSLALIYNLPRSVLARRIGNTGEWLDSTALPTYLYTTDPAMQLPAGLSAKIIAPSTMGLWQISLTPIP